MGSSTVSIQSLADLMLTMGPLSVAQAAGGFSSLTWLAISNDVANDLISQKFNWKWNQFKVPSFCTISYQTDYASVGQFGIGWLESGVWWDINNTSLPKPSWPLEVVRQLQPTSQSASPPAQACWLKNSTLQQGVWPGPGQVYTQPLGATQTPQNPPTNILDANGNILVLTTFGTTGATAPVAIKGATGGTKAADGTCEWTVADPDAQGIRVFPMPPMSGVVYLIDLIAQYNPPLFTDMGQMIDPIPDDYSGSFRDGFYTYSHKYAVDPRLKAQFPFMRTAWLQGIKDALKQGDREPEGAGFVPDRSVMGNGYVGDIGPANPYGSGWPWWTGGR